MRTKKTRRPVHEATLRYDGHDLAIGAPEALRECVEQVRAGDWPVGGWREVKATVDGRLMHLGVGRDPDGVGWLSVSPVSWQGGVPDPGELAGEYYPARIQTDEDGRLQWGLQEEWADSVRPEAMALLMGAITLCSGPNPFAGKLNDGKKITHGTRLNLSVKPR